MASGNGSHHCIRKTMDATHNTNKLNLMRKLGPKNPNHIEAY